MRRGATIQNLNEMKIQKRIHADGAEPDTEDYTEVGPEEEPEKE